MFFVLRASFAPAGNKGSIGPSDLGVQGLGIKVRDKAFSKPQDSYVCVGHWLISKLGFRIEGFGCTGKEMETTVVYWDYVSYSLNS